MRLREVHQLEWLRAQSLRITVLLTQIVLAQIILPSPLSIDISHTKAVTNVALLLIGDNW